MFTRVIYRIEHSSGSGLYSSGHVVGLNVVSGILQVKNEHKIHPHPKCNVHYYEYFGFKSKSQLKRWVTARKNAKELDKLGFIVALYRVAKRDIRKIDKSQVVFPLHEAMQQPLKFTIESFFG